MRTTTGDWPALEELYRSSRDDIYAYVLTLLRDVAAAEDVTALAFERAYRRSASFDRSRGGQRPWLFGIARNAALDELRRRKRVASLVAEPAELDNEPSADDDGEVLLRRTAVRAALAQLPARDRELIALKFHAGLSNRELASVLGVSESNAGTLLHRAVQKLRSAVNATACSDHARVGGDRCGAGRRGGRPGVRRARRAGPAAGRQPPGADRCRGDPPRSPRQWPGVRYHDPPPGGQGPRPRGPASPLVDLPPGLWGRAGGRGWRDRGGGPGQPWRLVRLLQLGRPRGCYPPDCGSHVRRPGADAHQSRRRLERGRCLRGDGLAHQIGAHPGGSSSSSQGSAFDPYLKNLSAPAAPSSAATVPTPAANGQKIVQSSQLSLTAPSDRINQVSQELFDVVGAEQGLVKHSSVTAGAGGYASFTLSIPTGNLSATLSRLASLKYSRVTSSTESTTDVTDTYQDDQRKLADAKALHTALLKQLADAYTSSQIDSLDAQIKDNEATIGADEATLNSLASQISYTSVSVQINAGNITSPHTGSGAGGFTLHKAGHDALRVLVIVAGVALIVLAVLVPLGLVLGLLTWVRVSWRRRRRESALDAA